ncbi:MAG: exodeoxyribonuclease VII large subunit [Chloroflexi bacterium]|nr:exodeoxyribonuclease VII large subunit [Chloroflexota bacterium]
MEPLPFFKTPLTLTVEEITRYIRQMMESDEVLRDVRVLGEVSNLSMPKSGHIYFTLKDHAAQLQCVIWRSQAVRIRFALQDGMAVEAHGAISVFERDGKYQLYVSTLQPVGEGLLYQEFLRLKAMLEAEGLFDEARKRPLPAFPQKIGIISSPTGAALQDMLNTLRTRYPIAEVILAPSAVQGAEAPAELVRALHGLNSLPDLDVILLARGGGSLEDLWAFNDEHVVRAVASSRVPVISGVGHETDFTLVDFAADFRAPTPTGAAVAATPDRKDLLLNLLDTRMDLLGAYTTRVSTARERLSNLQQRLQRGSPVRRVQDGRQALDQLSARALRAASQRVKWERSQLTSTSERLSALNPANVLQRGYAILNLPDGSLLKSVAQAPAGQDFQVQLSDGRFSARAMESPPPTPQKD